MGLKEKRMFFGVMTKGEVFLLKKERGNLDVNNRNEDEERELVVDMIVVAEAMWFAWLRLTVPKTKRGDFLLMGFLLGLLLMGGPR